MSQARAINISYDLHPPTDVPEGNLSASKTHNFPVSSTSPSDLNEYYTELKKSLAYAKDIVGNELTEWRDAVGKWELLKEPKLQRQGADLDDGDDGEEEEEGEA